MHAPTHDMHKIFCDIVMKRKQFKCKLPHLLKPTENFKDMDEVREGFFLRKREVIINIFQRFYKKLQFNSKEYLGTLL